MLSVAQKHKQNTNTMSLLARSCLFFSRLAREVGGPEASYFGEHYAMIANRYKRRLALRLAR
jgi:hypothetical protein